MVDEPENLTSRLLQELRSDMHGLRAGVEDLRTEVKDLRTDLSQRIDGNTLILNIVAGIVHDHEHRLQRLETPDR